MKVFIDSGGWLSVLIATDQHHEAGKGYFQTLMALGARILTTDFVLDEVVTRLRYDVGHRVAADFLTLVHEAVREETLTIVRINEDLWNQAELIFIKYSDVVFSFTDCTSFAFLNGHPVDEVFGFDAHFEMMGFLLHPKS